MPSQSGAVTEFFIVRKWLSEESTVGEMYCGDRFLCFILEDKRRELKTAADKVKGKTAIPEGRYPLVIDFSQRFQKTMPHILAVPYFEGIRIHPGNTAADTEGCPLTGKARLNDKVLFSVAAYEEDFLPALRAALAKGKVYVTVQLAEGAGLVC